MTNRSLLVLVAMSCCFSVSCSGEKDETTTGNTDAEIDASGSAGSSGSSGASGVVPIDYPDPVPEPCLDADSVIAAASCSVDDVNAAIDEAAAQEGGIVCLPSCDVSLDDTGFQVPGGIQIIGAGREATLLRDAFFAFNADHYGEVGDGLSRLSSMSIINDFDEKNSYFTFRSLQGIRVDHMYFEGRFSTFANITLPPGERAWAVFDHCEFDLVTSYGLYAFGDDNYRENVDSTDCVGLFGTDLGAGGTVFVEDCVFRGFYDHLMDARRATHYVFRHNTVIFDDGSGPIEGHGPTDPNNDLASGTNCMEIYGVEITQNGSQAGAGILFRSGCGVVFNTTVTGKRSGVALAVEGSPYDWIDHPYPAYQQPHGIWMWNNTFDVSPEDEIAIVWASDDHIVEERDYFLREPSAAEDGFEYTLYPYPHPATGP